MSSISHPWHQPVNPYFRSPQQPLNMSGECDRVTGCEVTCHCGFRKPTEKGPPSVTPVGQARGPYRQRKDSGPPLLTLGRPSARGDVVEQVALAKLVIDVVSVASPCLQPAATTTSRRPRCPCRPVSCALLPTGHGAGLALWMPMTSPLLVFVLTRCASNTRSHHPPRGVNLMKSFSVMCPTAKPLSSMCPASLVSHM